MASFGTSRQLPVSGKANAFTSEPAHLWEELDIWVKIRNTVAHQGTWRIPVGVRTTTKRQKLEEEIGNFSALPGDRFPMGMDSILSTVKSACEITLYQAIANGLGEEMAQSVD